jgi:hypothetical protein
VRTVVVAGLVLAAGLGLALAGIFGFDRGVSDPAHPADAQPDSSRFSQVTDARFCKELKAEAELTNREGPITLDAVTRFEGMAVVCSQRTVTFSKSVALNTSGLTPGWREAYQRGHDQTTCENELYATMTRRGWRMAQRVTFANGEYAHFETAGCPAS